MSNLMSSVDSRTNLVGQNRLELLLFNLRGQQAYAINVFKVREVLALPKVTVLPHQHPNIHGVVHLRGMSIPVYDLSRSIGMRPLDITEESTIIVTEYNSSVQAFVVGSVDRIVNMNWEDIKPPPSGSGRHHFLTAITHNEGRIVEIIDVEKVLSEVQPAPTEIPSGILADEVVAQAAGREVLMVDDSLTALSQARTTLESIGIVVHQATDGAKGLEKLKSWSLAGEKVSEKLLMLITDAEMPVMDGYMLTTEIRRDPALQDLFIVLHTSLSGSFNEAMVKKVGCDAFLSKFRPEDLANLVQERIRAVTDL
ncbi:MAG: chemotaxis protein CheV [Natronospirillum sp.]|uniref:chemotaxis protein CheV n=1 Tax=Natronospirillum sp. TaxID=2812955 RepID=UPI0025ECD344|nr:chemotaxis protein CheV [Natronospirillum sp.]MCH8550665.1 chemotaxis protein CheV [Natronospirillum sp.]